MENQAPRLGTVSRLHRLLRSNWITSIGAALMIGYHPRPLQILGMVIVLAGVVQAQLRLARRRRALAVSPLD